MLSKEDSFHSNRMVEYLPIKFIDSNRAVGEIPLVETSLNKNMNEIEYVIVGWLANQ